jgi:hypothetical protein
MRPRSGGPIGVDTEGTAGPGGDGERVGTVFLVKEDEEFCFLFERDDPAGLYTALLGSADASESGLSRGEALEVIEGMVPQGLRSI